MFYGWKLAGIGSFGNLMLQGGIIYAMNAFMDPLCEAHGWSRASIGLSLGFASLCGTASMPVLLALRQRVSLRAMMTAGAVAGGLAHLGMAFTGQIVLFALCLALAMVSGQAFGGVAANLLMQRWFVCFRGRAFGLVNMGTSLSGAVLPLAALVLVDAMGVAWGYFSLACLLLLASPLVWLLVRDTPACMGLQPDGGKVLNHLDPHQGRMPDALPFSVRGLFESRAAWTIGIAFGLGLLTVAGVSSQLKPRLTDVGLGSYQAMACMCLTALCGAVGKYGWGWLCDAKSPLFAARLLFACNAFFLGLILLPPGFTALALFIVGYGSSMGGLWTVFPALIAQIYGPQHFAFAYQYLSLFLAFKALGYPLMGLSSTRLGSYDPAYALMIALLAASCLMLCLFRAEGCPAEHTAN